MRLGIEAGVILLMIPILSSCAAPQGELAGRAKSALVGLSDTDIHMCAGHPSAVDGYKGGQILMYEHDAVPPGGVAPPAMPIPWTGTQISETPLGYCRVLIRLESGKVKEVSYAGQTDIWGTRDAACAPIVRSCIEYPARRK